MYHSMNIQLVEKGITILKTVSLVHRFFLLMMYLRDRGCENNDFIKLANPLHELIHARSLDHVHIVVLPFDLHGNGEVGLSKDLCVCQQSNRMDQSIVLTLKLLCTRVSSKSRTRHFFPLNSGLMGPRRYFCWGSDKLVSDV